MSQTEAYVEYPQESLTEQRFPEDFDYDDITIGQTLLHACRRRADHSEKEGLSSCLSSSLMSHDRTEKSVVCRDICHEQGHEIQRHNSESEQIRTLLDRQREQILADCQAEIRMHEFQADHDRRSVQKLHETIESQKEEICRAHQGDERRRQDHQLLHEQLLKQNWDLREAHEKSLNEMEELKRFEGSTFDTIARRRLVEDQDTILELTGNGVSRDQESSSRSSRRSARSRSLKSHSDHCAWSKISKDGMSGEELIDVRKMVIFGGRVQKMRRGRRRGLIFPQVMVKLVEAVRTTIPVDMQVPRFGRNRRRR